MDPQPDPSSAPDVSDPPQGGSSNRIVASLWWVLKLLLALFLFVGSLQLMKTGATDLDLLRRGSFLVANAGSTLGLGWLGSLLVLSGAPMANTAVALVAAGNINETQGFMMLTGARLGAAFVVLVTAVIYALRAKEGGKMKTVSTAVMALSTTALVYIPAGAVGLLLLGWGPYHRLSLEFPGGFSDLLDVIYGGVLERVADQPPALVFLGGLALLLLSLKAIDSVMPEMEDGSISDTKLQWLHRKWTMFGLGALVALITMSVSVSLTVLVPLVAKGYAKREDIIPYIMGANIATLGEKMIAAFALHSAAGVRIVLAEIIATTILSVILLAFFYPQVKSGIWRFQRVMVRSKFRLAAFTATLFLLPIAVIGVSGVVG